MIVVVTGASGNVGAAVVDELRALGADARPALKPGFDFVDASTYGTTVAGADGLFLLRPPPIGDVKSTLNVLVDRAVDAGVKHIVFLSVAGVQDKRWVPHHAVEEHVRKTGVPFTFLRAGFFMQNLVDAYARDIRERGEISASV